MESEVVIVGGGLMAEHGQLPARDRHRSRSEERFFGSDTRNVTWTRRKLRARAFASTAGAHSRRKVANLCRR
jgi:hypothetical protein